MTDQPIDPAPADPTPDPVTDPTGGVCFEPPESGLLDLGLERFEEERIIEFGHNGDFELDHFGVTFDAATGAFSMETDVDEIRVSEAVTGLSPTGIQIEVNVELDADGNLVGGSDTDLLIFDDANGNGIAEAEEILLQGEAVALGHATDTGWEADTFEFLFDISGGVLAGEFEDLMALEIDMLFSDWDGDFDEDFNGYAKGITGNSGVAEVCETPDDPPPPPDDDLPPPPNPFDGLDGIP